MPDPIIWPARLAPAQVLVNLTPFSRSGGASIGGIKRSIRTDRGWWRIGFRGVALYNAALRRLWNAIRVEAGGTVGNIAVPAWSHDSAPNAGTVLVPHSDGSSFSDTSLYSQPGVRVDLATEAVRGATSVTLRIESGIDELAGVRFSYQHALYETGFPTAVVGDLWTVPVFPAIRATIPADVRLEFDVPTCLVHLASDDAMDVSFSAGGFDSVNVDFVEATDYWADLVEE
jgi:hypothetical protein